MIRYLIKNNFKLMARSKTNFLLFVITPLILIALLSSAFNDLMKKYEGDVSISAGYRIDDDTSTEILDALKDAAEEGERDEALEAYISSDQCQVDIDRLIRRDYLIFEDGFRHPETRERLAGLIEYTAGLSGIAEEDDPALLDYLSARDNRCRD